MAGRHVRPGRPSATSRSDASGPRGTRNGPRHALEPRTFQGTPLTISGVTRDAMGSSALVGSSVPKGLFSSAVAAFHAQAANTLVGNEAAAQQSIATALAAIDAIGKSRSLRAAARNAEGIAPSSSQLTIEAARLLANGRGPRVAVLGMVAGDVARTVAEFDRYGYTVNRAMVPPRLDPMTSRSYWQLDTPTILGDMPQVHRETIAAAFEQGVTVWTNVAEIGTHSANAARPGVSY